MSYFNGDSTRPFYDNSDPENTSMTIGCSDKGDYTCVQSLRSWTLETVIATSSPVMGIRTDGD